ncbi:conserved hypothetical protein, membrane [Candidatus Thiomargarita nelsonii]|uniref:CHAT domain-containing protein n=1 Tax=Candidatus Thiomargarita nelsonii TaxID=1003181 RepID=A0A176RT69_9GAMM|nr:conserved hypothetical protein, membrane [Candidatus Thiomargarita nelsonii]
MPEPKHTEISDNFFDQNWDIFVFAGHSEKDQFSINSNVSLKINDLKKSLEKAIKHGLQLAIFNSCDGLELANALMELNIPQVIVMRELVPDIVAQLFFKFFIKAFSNGTSLYLAVREARLRMDEWAKDKRNIELPAGSTWLPVIFQNQGAKPLEWKWKWTEEIENMPEQKNIKLRKPFDLSEEESHNPAEQKNSEKKGDEESKKRLVSTGLIGLSMVLAFIVFVIILEKSGRIPPDFAIILHISIVGVAFFIIIIVVFQTLPVGRALIFIVLTLIILLFVLAVIHMITQSFNNHKNKPNTNIVSQNGGENAPNKLPDKTNTGFITNSEAFPAWCDSENPLLLRVRRDYYEFVKNPPLRDNNNDLEKFVKENFSSLFDEPSIMEEYRRLSKEKSRRSSKENDIAMEQLKIRIRHRKEINAAIAYIKAMKKLKLSLAECEEFMRKYEQDYNNCLEKQKSMTLPDTTKTMAITCQGYATLAEELNNKCCR